MSAMFVPREGQPVIQVATDMVIRVVAIADLRESEQNAHVMPSTKYERLTENVMLRKALESVPYCCQIGGEGPIVIVSGHHRVRAARAAGLTEIPILLDTAKYSRSQRIAKQLAHNALVGYDDGEVLRELVAKIDNLEDLIQTGLPEDFLPTVEKDSTRLFQPVADFDWRTVTFLFLPHQQEALEQLCGRLRGRQDLIATVPEPAFEPFLEAAAKFAKLKNIHAAGTAVALLTEIALREVAAGENADA